MLCQVNVETVSGGHVMWSAGVLGLFDDSYVIRGRVFGRYGASGSSNLAESGD